MAEGSTMQIWPGSAYPLGATYDGSGTNFALFSEVADRVELCLFDPDGAESRIDLPEMDGFVWHAFVPGIEPGQRYGYRVHGPYEPEHGLRCNPAKLLLDPYAKAVEGSVDWHPSLFSYDLGDPDSHNTDDSAPLDRGLSNYWGYNTISFFAPDTRYSSASSQGSAGGQVQEFKAMVRALHDADIEVILDVVYNHTAEGNHLGPTLCFRGIDNRAYYRLEDDEPQYYRDYTGTGNSLNV